MPLRAKCISNINKEFGFGFCVWNMIWCRCYESLTLSDNELFYLVERLLGLRPLRYANIMEFSITFFSDWVHQWSKGSNKQSRVVTWSTRSHELIRLCFLLWSAGYIYWLWLHWYIGLLVQLWLKVSSYHWLMHFLFTASLRTEDRKFLKAISYCSRSSLSQNINHEEFTRIGLVRPT